MYKYIAQDISRLERQTISMFKQVCCWQFFKNDDRKKKKKTEIKEKRDDGKEREMRNREGKKR